MSGTFPLPFRFGAEVYTWFMQEEGKAYANRLDHMIRVSAAAGFAGIEPVHSWMGDLSDPARLKDELREAGMALAAVALVLEWNGPEETEAERRQADETIQLLQRFPGALLCTVQLPTGRHDLAVRQKNLVSNVNAASRRAADAGVVATFHPNSPHTSIHRTEEDYRIVLENLDASVTGWTPDVGHIANGGMDPLAKMQEYESLINHVHYKDWDGDPEFVVMGAGKIDFAGITNWLLRKGYEGWVICEDEGPEAIEDPDGVTRHDGRWIRDTLLPALSDS